MRRIAKIFLLSIFICVFASADASVEWKTKELDNYRLQLLAFRIDYKEAEQPDVKFFLFGMGNRTKMIYKNGLLYNAFDATAIKKWEVAKELIIPNLYLVQLELKNGDFVEIQENENGVYISQNNQIELIPGTKTFVHLPEFTGNSYNEILKVLHHEILINIVDSKPVPNLFVYSNPWRRDAAMMAMCLEKTGNIDLIKDWVLSLDDPYDHNNGTTTGRPESEVDNLGQTLYLLSLFTNKNHPLVSSIMKEAHKQEKNSNGSLYISGRSDFHEVPAYQTKWMKYGLKKLKMVDPYTIPSVKDDYSSLFWWDYKDSYVPCEEYTDNLYPYLGWARDHFKETKTSAISNHDYPLTWETNASEADYKKLSVLDDVYVLKKTSAPHTWHASEIFLYLTDPELFPVNASH